MNFLLNGSTVEAAIEGSAIATGVVPSRRRAKEGKARDAMARKLLRVCRALKIRFASASCQTQTVIDEQAYDQ